MTNDPRTEAADERERGYVKLHRKAIDSAVFQCPNLWHLWTYLIMRANHKPAWVKIERVAEPVRLERGQLITGRFALQKALYPKGSKRAPHPSTIWKWLGALEHLGNLRTSTHSRYTLVTIVNYGTYNDADTDDAHLDAQQTRSRRAADAQQTRTNKKEEKLKNGKKKQEESAPPQLLELIDGWNELGPAIVKPGKGVRRDPPSVTVLRKWGAAMKEPEKRTALADIPALLAKIRGAKFCHCKGWFTFLWLFGKNQNSEFNLVKLTNGGYDDAGDGKQTNQPGPGQRYTPGVGDSKTPTF